MYIAKRTLKSDNANLLFIAPERPFPELVPVVVYVKLCKLKFVGDFLYIGLSVADSDNQ